MYIKNFLFISLTLLILVPISVLLIPLAAVGGAWSYIKDVCVAFTEFTVAIWKMK